MDLAMSMAQQGDLLLLGGLCSLLAFFLCVAIRRTFFRKSDLPFPPGPRGLPILGHLHLLGSLPHQSLANLSKTYGPLFSLRFGSFPAVIASSPSMAKLFLQTHDKIFAGRPQNFIIPRNAFNGVFDIAFSLPGRFWKLMRQLCVTEFLGPKRIIHFKPARMQEMRSLMSSILAAQGTAIPIRKRLHSTIMNVISRMTVGKSLQEISQEMGISNKSTAAILELFYIVGDFNVSDFIPSIAWMDLQGYGRRSKRLGRITYAFFQQVIDRRRSEHSRNSSASIDAGSTTPVRDFLDILLHASRDTATFKLEIGDLHIIAIIQDMFAAGTDTSAVTIEWALAQLLDNPQILKSLQEELDGVVGSSRLVEENDLPNLPYLQAVVYETLRLCSITPLLLPHMSMEASEVSGYHIPKGTLVYINAWAINRDPNNWDDPLKFCPERFLTNNLDELVRQCKFLPFGAGKRMCPGGALGLLNVQYLLANLVHAFDWQTLAKTKMKETFGLTLKLTEPLLVVPMPRLPRALLETCM